MAIAHYKLDIETHDVLQFARSIEQKQLSKNDRSFLHFAQDDWSGWLINGCRQVNRGGFVLGYTVDDLANRASFFPEACAIVDAVPGKKHAIRLFRLAPNVHIDLHVDTGEYYLHRHWREIRKVHVPIITNPGCRNYEEVDGVKQYYWLRPGEFWLLDGNQRHGAMNFGEEFRFHLVIDVDPTPELFNLCRRAEPTTRASLLSSGFVKML